jgi:kynurenine formamidase
LSLGSDQGLSVWAGNYEFEHYVLSIDRWQIELRTNFDKVPEAGALIVATWPKAKDGSGFPARAVAIHR